MRCACGLVAALSVLFTAGCAKQFPSQYTPSQYTRGELLGETGEKAEVPFTPPAPIQAKIDSIIDDHFPPPWTWSKADVAGDSDKEKLKHGQQLYQKLCVHCHGLSGAGDGPTAASLLPRPRDFRRGIFKWKSTANRAKPTREDLLRVLREGANGTSMPPFILLPKDQLEALADYVTYLSKRGQLERDILVVYSQEGPTVEELKESGESFSDEDSEELLEVVEETAEDGLEVITESWETAEDFVTEPEETEVPEPGTDAFEASVMRGRELFLGSNTGCTKCHGMNGMAQTKLSGADAVDIWGHDNPPRNLTLGLFRGGRRPIDIYRRLFDGIAGTSMPGQGSNPKVTPADIWDVVNFVRVLPDRPELLKAEPVGTLAAKETPAHKGP